MRAVSAFATSKPRFYQAMTTNFQQENARCNSRTGQLDACGAPVRFVLQVIEASRLRKSDTQNKLCRIARLFPERLAYLE